MMITVERLNELFDYDRDTGKFYRKIASSKNSVVGEKAGFVGTKGYIQMSVDNKTYQSHALVWLMETGEYPNHQIDHINRIKSDNRFVNLRKATNSENQRNRPAPKNNTSGFKNIRKLHQVTVSGEYDYWAVQIRSNGKSVMRKFPQTDDGLEEAIRVRDYLIKEMHKEFGCTE